MDSYHSGVSCKQFDYEVFWKNYPGPKKHLSNEIHQNIAFRLSDAFTKFFSKDSKNQKPRYKSIGRYRSFTYNGYKHGFNFGSNFVRGTVIGEVKAKITRPFFGKPKTLTIRKCKDGLYYAFLQFDVTSISKQNNIDRKFAVGIDLGMKKLVQMSNGFFIKRPWFVTNFYNQKMDKLTRCRLFRKTKDSKNWEKARLKYTKVCQKMKNQRLDYYFKIAYMLANNYQYVVCEDLCVSDMKHGKHFAPEAKEKIDLYGFYEFIEILNHMCNKYSSQLIKVDPRNTTQLCCVCGKTVRKTLDDRVHICPVCGLTVDRDLNAALNILHRGLGGRSTVGTTESIKLVELSVPEL